MQPSSTKETLIQIFQKTLLDNGRYETINVARKQAELALNTKILPGDPLTKIVDEAMEMAVVRSAPLLIAQSASVHQAYDTLVELMNRQPRLGVRSSTSIDQQAYSTPIPIAYFAATLAGINEQTLVYEPTVGNGALVASVNPANVIANELNPDRFAEVAKRGFRQLTQFDATQYVPDVRVDAVITNPPFGTRRSAPGKREWFEVPGNQRGTNQLDHAIAIKALSTLKDDGKAVLILGGLQGTNPEWKSEQYNKILIAGFYYALYQQYNVVDHFTIRGDLYRKQGTSFPIDVVVIHGRGRSDRSLPAVDLPRIYTSFDALKELLIDAPITYPRSVSPTSLDLESNVEPRDRILLGANSTEPNRNAPPAVSRTDATENSVSDRELDGIERRFPDAIAPSVNRDVAADFDAGTTLDRRSVELEDGMGGSTNTRHAQLEINTDLSDTRSSTERVRTEPDAIALPRNDAGNVADAASRGDTIMPDSTADDDLLVPYVPASRGPSLGTLTPKNLATASSIALQRLQHDVGDIDEFVRQRLGYGSLEEMFGPDGKRLCAEQVDAAALGMWQRDRGKVFLNADQTGNGKGRWCATQVIDAIRQGDTAVWIMQQADMYPAGIADLADIGKTNLRIFVTNTDLRLQLPDGQQSQRQSSAQKASEMQRIIDGEVKYDLVLTTYSQIQPHRGNETPRREFLRAIAAKSVFVFDEAHNAGGQTGAWTDADSRSRAAFARELVAKGKGVVFATATAVKDPAVLDLYAQRSDAKEAVPIGMLQNALSDGGVPLQQMMTAKFVESGGMLRRERSYEGVKVTVQTVKVNREAADRLYACMGAISRFDLAKADAVELIKKSLKAEAKAVRSDNATGDVGARSTSFASLMHNIVDQSLLGLKAEAASQLAITAQSQNQKPVLTCVSTMQTHIERYVEENNLASGDIIDLTYTDLLRHFLERSRDIITRDHQGNSEKRWLTDRELGADGVAAYQEALVLINSTDLSAIPMSFIDYQKQRLEQSGSTISEITGRSVQVDYASGNPVYALRPAEQQTPQAKVDTVAGFNDGRIDSLIINAAGFTGISIHASERFADQRQRHMIVSQIHQDINQVIQMFGRTHRFGQVIPPEITILVSDLPAERRTAALLSERMARLNANTTANRDSALSVVSASEFFSEYGEAAIEQILYENPEIDRKLAYPRDAQGEGELQLISRVTGRMPLLSIEEQEELYEMIDREVAAMIEQDRLIGRNPFAAGQLDLDARTIARAELIPPIRRGNAFGGAVYAELIDSKALVQPMTQIEAINTVREALGLASIHRLEEHDVEQVETIARSQAQTQVVQIRAALIEQRQHIQATAKNEASYDAAIKRWNKQGNHILEIVEKFVPGTSVSLLFRDRTDKDGEHHYSSTYGVIKQISPINEGKLLTLTSWKAEIIAQNFARTLPVRLSNFNRGMDYGMTIGSAQDTAYGDTVYAAFDRIQGSQREERVVLRGNLLAAYEKYPDQSFVYYTTRDGSIAAGMLMPRSFDLESEIAKIPVQFYTLETAKQFLTEWTGGAGILETHTESLNIRQSKDGFLLTAFPGLGGKRFSQDETLIKLIGQDFYSVSNRMQATVSDDLIDPVIDWLLNNNAVRLIAASHIDVARENLGQFLPELEWIDVRTPQPSPDSLEIDPGGSYSGSENAVNPHHTTNARISTQQATQQGVTQRSSRSSKTRLPGLEPSIDELRDRLISDPQVQSLVSTVQAGINSEEDAGRVFARHFTSALADMALQGDSHDALVTQSFNNPSFGEQLTRELLSEIVETTRLPQLLPFANQPQQAEQQAAKFLFDCGIAEAVLQGDDFHLSVENEPYQRFVIERHGDMHLYFTRYREHEGDIDSIDSEAVFKVQSTGHLTFIEAASRNPLTGGETRRHDRSFANTIIRALYEQGFVEATRTTYITTASVADLNQQVLSQVGIAIDKWLELDSESLDADYQASATADYNQAVTSITAAWQTRFTPTLDTYIGADPATTAPVSSAFGAIADQVQAALIDLYHPTLSPQSDEHDAIVATAKVITEQLFAHYQPAIILVQLRQAIREYSANSDSEAYRSSIETIAQQWQEQFAAPVQDQIGRYPEIDTLNSLSYQLLSPLSDQIVTQINTLYGSFPPQSVEYDAIGSIAVSVAEQLVKHDREQVFLSAFARLHQFTFSDPVLQIQARVTTAETRLNDLESLFDRRFDQIVNHWLGENPTENQRYYRFLETEKSSPGRLFSVQDTLRDLWIERIHEQESAEQFAASRSPLSDAEILNQIQTAIQSFTVINYPLRPVIRSQGKSASEKAEKAYHQACDQLTTAWKAQFERAVEAQVDRFPILDADDVFQREHLFSLSHEIRQTIESSIGDRHAETLDADDIREIAIEIAGRLVRSNREQVFERSLTEFRDVLWNDPTLQRQAEAFHNNGEQNSHIIFEKRFPEVLSDWFHEDEANNLRYYRVITNDTARNSQLCDQLFEEWKAQKVRADVDSEIAAHIETMLHYESTIDAEGLKGTEREALIDRHKASVQFIAEAWCDRFSPSIHAVVEQYPQIETNPTFNDRIPFAELTREIHQTVTRAVPTVTDSRALAKVTETVRDALYILDHNRTVASSIEALTQQVDRDLTHCASADSHGRRIAFDTQFDQSLLQIRADHLRLYRSLHTDPIYKAQVHHQVYQRWIETLPNRQISTATLDQLKTLYPDYRFTEEAVGINRHRDTILYVYDPDTSIAAHVNVSQHRQTAYAIAQQKIDEHAAMRATEPFPSLRAEFPGLRFERRLSSAGWLIDAFEKEKPGRIAVGRLTDRQNQATPDQLDEFKVSLREKGYSTGVTPATVEDLPESVEATVEDFQELGNHVQARAGAMRIVSFANRAFDALLDSRALRLGSTWCEGVYEGYTIRLEAAPKQASMPRAHENVTISSANGSLQITADATTGTLDPEIRYSLSTVDLDRWEQLDQQLAEAGYGTRHQRQLTFLSIAAEALRLHGEAVMKNQPSLFEIVHDAVIRGNGITSLLTLDQTTLPLVYTELHEELIAHDNNLSPNRAGELAAARLWNGLQHLSNELEEKADLHGRGLFPDALTLDEEQFYDRVFVEEWDWKTQIIDWSKTRTILEDLNHPYAQVAIFEVIGQAIAPPQETSFISRPDNPLDALRQIDNLPAPLYHYLSQKQATPDEIVLIHTPANRTYECFGDDAIAVSRTMSHSPRTVNIEGIEIATQIVPHAQLDAVVYLLRQTSTVIVNHSSTEQSVFAAFTEAQHAQAASSVLSIENPILRFEGGSAFLTPEEITKIADIFERKEELTQPDLRDALKQVLQFTIPSHSIEAAVAAAINEESELSRSQQDSSNLSTIEAMNDPQRSFSDRYAALRNYSDVNEHTQATDRLIVEVFEAVQLALQSGIQFEVGTPGDLAEGYFKLSNPDQIQLNNVDDSVWLQVHKSTAQHPFIAVFDGDWHTIEQLVTIQQWVHQLDQLPAVFNLPVQIQDPDSPASTPEVSEEEWNKVVKAHTKTYAQGEKTALRRLTKIESRINESPTLPEGIDRKTVSLTIDALREAASSKPGQKVIKELLQGGNKFLEGHSLASLLVNQAAEVRRSFITAKLAAVEPLLQDLQQHYPHYQFQTSNFSNIAGEALPHITIADAANQRIASLYLIEATPDSFRKAEAKLQEHQATLTQSPDPECAKLPKGVVTTLNHHLNSLRAIVEQIESARNTDHLFNGNGRYEFEVAGGQERKRINDTIAVANSAFDKFRELAPTRHVDADLVFAELGSIPVIPPLSEAAQTWETPETLTPGHAKVITEWGELTATISEIDDFLQVEVIGATANWHDYPNCQYIAHVNLEDWQAMTLELHDLDAYAQFTIQERHQAFLQVLDQESTRIEASFDRLCSGKADLDLQLARKSLSHCSDLVEEFQTIYPERDRIDLTPEFRRLAILKVINPAHLDSVMCQSDATAKPKEQLELQIDSNIPLGDRSVAETYDLLNALYLDHLSTAPALLLQPALDLLEGLELAGSSMSGRHKGIPSEAQLSWQSEADTLIAQFQSLAEIQGSIDAQTEIVIADLLKSDDGSLLIISEQPDCSAILSEAQAIFEIAETAFAYGEQRGKLEEHNATWTIKGNHYDLSFDPANQIFSVLGKHGNSMRLYRSLETSAITGSETIQSSDIKAFRQTTEFLQSVNYHCAQSPSTTVEIAQSKLNCSIDTKIVQPELINTQLYTNITAETDPAWKTLEQHPTSILTSSSSDCPEVSIARLDLWKGDAYSIGRSSKHLAKIEAIKNNFPDQPLTTRQLEVMNQDRQLWTDQAIDTANQARFILERDGQPLTTGVFYEGNLYSLFQCDGQLYATARDRGVQPTATERLTLPSQLFRGNRGIILKQSGEVIERESTTITNADHKRFETFARQKTQPVASVASGYDR